MSRTLSSESILRLALVSCALPMFVSSALPISFPTPSCGSLVPPSGSSVFFCGRLRRQQRHLDLWLRCLPAGLLARERNTRQEKTNRSSQPMVPSEPVGPTESIPPTPRGPESTLDTPQRTAGAPREHRHPEISPASPPERIHYIVRFVVDCKQLSHSYYTVTTQLLHSYYTVTTQLLHEEPSAKTRFVLK